MNRPCLASPLPVPSWQTAFPPRTEVDATGAYLLLQHQQQGWRALPVASDVPLIRTGSLQVLADLMRYGIVGPLAELAPGNLLWLPIFPELGEAELRELHLASLLTANQSSNHLSNELPNFAHALQWQVADASLGDAAHTSAAQADNLAHARILGGTRSLCAGLQLPLVDLRLLSALFAITALPAGPLALVWPARAELAQGFLAQMQPGVRQALLAQQEILRQLRRQALQLPVDMDSAVLDAHIYRHLILPAAQYYLRLGSQASCANQRNDLYLVAELPAGCESLTLPHTQFSLHDPLGENLYALALRRLCFSERRSQLRRQFKIAPRALTRQVQALDVAQQDGAAQAMLAALQLDFLHAESV